MHIHSITNKVGKKVLNKYGSVVNSYSYTPFGQIHSCLGSLSNPYQFVGGEFYWTEEEIGLYLLGQRWYDAEVGRFISRGLTEMFSKYCSFCKKDGFILWDQIYSFNKNNRPEIKIESDNKQQKGLADVSNPQLIKCLQAALTNLIICLGVTEFTVGTFETYLFFGCLLSGPALPACFTVSNLICLPSNATAIWICAQHYLEERRECYRKYKFFNFGK